MAVHQSPRANNQEREDNIPTSNAAVTTTAMPTTSPPGGRTSIAMGADPEDMLLLREKLNQIAVGRRHVGDNQIDHMEDSGEDDDVNGRSAARRRRTAPGNGHFRMFLPVGDRPSTPPSSPQPRDVLRRHLRLKSHVPPLYTTQRSTGLDDNNSDTTTDDLLDGMCVDGIEISPLPDGSHRVMPSHPTVRLSVPEHLRVRPSSYNMHTKCPEGLRKRKSVYMDDKDLLIDGQSVVAPLKKVSSQVNILSSSTSVTSSTSPVADVSCDQEMEDVSSDPSDSPTDGSPCS